MLPNYYEVTPSEDQIIRKEEIDTKYRHDENMVPYTKLFPTNRSSKITVVEEKCGGRYVTGCPR